MKLEISARAGREIRAALKWWVDNRRDAPALLSDELDEYLDKLKESPDLGAVWQTRRGQLIRKVLLPCTKKQLYVTRPDVNTVRILCLWGGQRGRPPKL